MKLVFFDVDPWAKPHIHKEFPTAELVTDRLSNENVHIYKEYEVVSTFHTSDLSCDIINALPHLKMIATRSTGFNHIDTGVCTRRKIVASYVPSYGKHTVAEHTFGLILTLTRKIYDAIYRTKHDGQFHIVGLQGTDLFGKTLGIVGLGEIGMAVMKIAKGFGMNVLVFTRTQDASMAQEYEFEYAPTLESLLNKSDVVSLHCPLLPQTHHLINQKSIEHFKKGAYLINTARGGLVDSEALLQALESGVLAGVGLDVLENEVDFQEEADLISSHIRKKIDYENLVIDHILLKHPRVVVTPHNAFNSTEARLRILRTTFDNIHAFIDGKPQNIIAE